ncbi:hypothetical protein ABTZ03_42505 [Kitasatospora sp. NPDC096077]|uniref:hypothetical protein n=1 Tax=Kitasatospora sp. NPDC096077 TaxID=3155544 RepID=UPI003332B433
MTMRVTTVVGALSLAAGLALSAAVPAQAATAGTARPAAAAADSSTETAKALCKAAGFRYVIVDPLGLPPFCSVVAWGPPGFVAIPTGA